VYRGKTIKVQTPLIHLSKKEIIQLAVKLKVPLPMTWSCYQGGQKPCGVCDSCRLREQGFKDAGIQQR
jgi:7-cyano-7-deazaguanine synthase